MDKNTKQLGKLVKKATEQTEIYNGQCQTQVLLNIIFFVYLFMVMTGEMFVPGWSSRMFEFQLGDK